MLSKPEPSPGGLLGASRPGAALPSRRQAEAVAREVAARAAAAWGSLAGGSGSCGPRLPWAAAGAAERPPTIRTTVAEGRAPRAPRRVLCISTTVGEMRTRQTAAAATSAEAAAPARSSGEGKAQQALDMEEAGSLVAALGKAAAASLAGPMLALPLQLLSPWSGLAGASGIALAAGPCGMAPPPTPQQRAMMMQMQALQQEEEQFAALIFPGFDANAFIWQVTCWQVAEFVFSMCLGHNRANPTPCVLYRLGASWGPAITRGAVWRLVAPVMLHANLTHLLFNVFFQLRMGFGMEKQFGRGKMMMIYFACGLFGNLMSVTLDPYKLAVGASTAGFGLIGVWLAEILLSWEILGPARERTIIWIVFMLISVTTMSSMTPNMDLYGHLGGALGGFLLSIVISDMREQDRPEWYGQARAAAALGLALFLAGGLTKVMLLSPGDPLPDCPLLFRAVASAAAAAATGAAPGSAGAALHAAASAATS